MRRYLLLLLLVTFASGCTLSDLFPGPSDTDLPADVGTGDSALKRFDSEQEFVSYFSGQVMERNDRYAFLDPMGGWEDGVREGDFDAAVGGNGGSVAPGGEAPSGDLTPGQGGDNSLVGVPPTEPSPNDEFSDTTTQEVGVEEADVVKTDGQYLYVIADETLHIVLASPAQDLEELAQVSLEGYGRDIYLHDDKVIALTTSHGEFQILAGGGTGSAVVVGEDGVAIDDTEPAESEVPDSDPADSEPGFIETVVDIPFVYSRPKVVVTVIDVADPYAPRVVSVTRFDGSQSSSRMIDNMLHLVISNYPYYYRDILPMLGTPELDMSSIQAEALLPQYDQVDADGAVSQGDVVTWQSLYRPVEPDGFGTVSVVSLDVDSPSGFSAVGIVAEPGLIYSSTEALYLSNTKFDFSLNARETTNIYKFAYVAGGVEPVAVGSVPGRILNQYSMSEYQGYLRVATTLGPTFFFEGDRLEATNAVYVLEQVDDGLTVVGSVEDIAPRETIQAARFIGDRGYVVTFEQIDPLFTLDLSDPTNPQVVGELKVPGFSTFIVPLDADHLLTVGQYIPEEGPFWNWGVQLSIFDISDFANPRLQHNAVLAGEDGAWSEALYDPKAFTYFAQRGLVALPAEIYDYSGGWDRDFMAPDELEDILLEMLENGELDGADGIPEDFDGSLDELAEMLMEGIFGDFFDDLPADDPFDEDADAGAPDDDDPFDSDFFDDILPPFEDNSFVGLVIFQVSAADGFTEVGRLSTSFTDSHYRWSSFTRGVFIGEDVFAITNHGVRGGSLENLENTTYEAVFESDEPWWPGVIGIEEPAMPELPGS